MRSLLNAGVAGDGHRSASCTVVGSVVVEADARGFGMKLSQAATTCSRRLST